MKAIKAAISLAWYVLFSLRGWMQVLLGVHRTRYVVLYYHAVKDAEAAGFSRQVKALARSCRVIPLGSLGSVNGPRTCVSISFDDAFVSVRDNALPCLQQHRMPVTIFAPSANLGDVPRWHMEDGSRDAGERVMSGSELVAIQNELVEIGSHSRTHPRLSELDERQLSEEVAGSKAELEQILNQPVSMLAFPYGDRGHQVVEACRKAGYTRVFGISPELTYGRTFEVGRVAVDPTDGRLVFFLKRSGAYSWVPLASRLKRLVRAWRI